MKPKVSVVSVYYNRENLVRESLQSILDQTLRNFELILVDDGSTDSTLEELQKLDDPRVRVVHHGNIGFVRSIREAVALSHGDYIAVHGSGDFSYPERLESQSRYLDEHPEVGLVACHSEKINLVTAKEVVFRPKTEDLDLIKETPLGHGEVMYRRAAYDRAGGYRDFFTYSQDYDLFLRMYEFTGVHILQEVLYRKFTQADGVSGIPQKRFLQCFYNEMAKDCARARMAGDGDLVERYGNAAWLMRPTSTNGAALACPTVWLAFRRGEPDVAVDLAKRIFHEALTLKSAVILVLAFLRRRVLNERRTSTE